MSEEPELGVGDREPVGDDLKYSPRESAKAKAGFQVGHEEM